MFVSFRVIRNTLVSTTGGRELNNHDGREGGKLTTKTGGREINQFGGWEVNKQERREGNKQARHVRGE